VSSIDPKGAIAMSTVLIGGGYFAESIVLLQALPIDTTRTKIRVKFNSAMAIWGLEKKPPITMFQEVLSTHDEAGAEEAKNANYNQCMGLAFAVLGRKGEAIEALSRARLLVEQQHGAFSCWSYLERGEIGFAKDIDEMRCWIATGAPHPAVFQSDGGQDRPNCGDAVSREEPV
jgi:hypothetical protein